tara:strand:+ start:1668 stop:2813 length:1146 start_codon:yes stop_codon:yes gene_type:complete
MKNIGVIGCGNILETYLRSQEYFNNINFISCADINMELAKKTASENNLKAQTVEELLSDNTIDIVLNITIPQAHYEVSKKILESGKHVYSEKPMSVKYEQANELLKISKSKNLYFGNAPDTFLGGGGQLSREIIDSNQLGDILTGNFIFAFPGVQDFHPNPESWFQDGGGPVIDMGPYFFTTLVNLLGPAINIRSRGVKFSDKREYKAGPKKGKYFNVDIPTSYMFNLEFENKAIIQGFISFDVLNHNRNHVELYGTKGSIIVPDPNMFGGPVITSMDLGSDWIDHSVETKPLGKTNILNKTVRSNEAPKQSNYRGIGLSEMVYAIENKLEQRCNGELALHVLDIIECAMIAAENSTEIKMRSTCNKPMPLKDDEIQRLLK